MKTDTKPAKTTPSNRGGSLLPSSAPHILKVMSGKRGAFQVRDLGDDLDSAGLFFKPVPCLYNPEPKFGLIAMHPNGFSCHDLAQRILKAWENPTEYLINRVIVQAQCILDCGGMCKSLDGIRFIASPLPL